MKISRYIFLSFLFILLLFSITTFINFRLSETVAENSRFFSKSTELMKQSGRFQRNMISMVSGLRGYLITGEKYFIASYDSADSENGLILQELSSIVEDSSQMHLLNEIKQLSDTWVNEYAAPLKAAKSLVNGNDSNLAAYNKLYREKFLKGDEKRIQLELQQKFKEFTNYEYAMREYHSNELASSIKTTGRISVVLTVLSLVAGLTVVIFLIRLISKRISLLVKMADAIASNNYHVDLKYAGDDELSALVFSLDHMAQELSKNISELQSKNKELDQFAHIVSHDLKSPLRGIDNVISWIEEDHYEELSPKMKEYVQTIKGRVTRAENLIQGILAYARVDSEAIEKEMVDVNAMLDDIVSDMLLGHNVQVGRMNMPHIYSERIPLLQVFSNLISNAIKYNDKQQCSVSISYKEYPKYYEFFAKDNGPGIAPGYHKRIFVIFQTLVERDSFESTGVGLAIVKKILDARKQHITIESEPGRGTTFSFTWEKSKI
jgi:signal transduction histidine kinase